VDHLRGDRQRGRRRPLPRPSHAAHLRLPGYFSIPLFRPDGAYFGTVCGLDPVPKELSTHKVTSTLKLFAQLISVQLENNRKLAEAEHALSNGAKRAWASVCSLSPRLPSRMAVRSP